MPINERIEAERSTLHYFRRFVSQYYGILAVLYELKIIPKNTLHTYWSEVDLRVIQKILIPIEKKLEETLDTLVEKNPVLARLQKLYDDSQGIKF